eukprot:gb/GECG01013209.1/.p1 GENE.gb/GECG01013209.1/~~gb/GECG01013209.1/.p1  ORF type:complete len:272 (+),score=30.34 gb/GECG01013209.1/:1-816(+)
MGDVFSREYTGTLDEVILSFICRGHDQVSRWVGSKGLEWYATVVPNNETWQDTLLRLYDKYGRKLNSENNVFDGVNMCHPLACAAYNGNVPVVRFLIERCHVDVNADSPGKTTALFRATVHWHLEVIKILVEEYGADMTLRSKRWGKYVTPLEYTESQKLEHIRYARHDSRGWRIQLRTLESVHLLLSSLQATQTSLGETEENTPAPKESMRNVSKLEQSSVKKWGLWRRRRSCVCLEEEDSSNTEREHLLSASNSVAPVEDPLSPCLQFH